MPVDLARLEALFSEALKLATPAERAAYLARACGGDPELRRRVEGLLASHEAAGSFLAPAGLHQNVRVRVPESRFMHTPLPAGVGRRFMPSEQVAEPSPP